MAKEAQVMCLPPLPLVGSLGLQSQLPWLEGQDYRHQLHWYLGSTFSLCYSQTTFFSFFFFSYLMLGQEGTPEIMQENYLCVELSTQHRTLAFVAPTL